MKYLAEIMYAGVLVAVINVAWDMAKGLYRRRRSQTALIGAPDWGLRMQEAAEKHLSAVSDAYLAEELDEDPSVPSPAIAPYCGCETCVVREVLAGAWPVIVEMSEFNHERGLQVRQRADDDRV